MMETRPGASQLPALFVSHGAPSVALESGPYPQALSAFGRRYDPRAIIVASAHWESQGTIEVGSAPRHSALYDFGGFAPELYRMRYDAPGLPGLAAEVAARLAGAGFHAALDPTRPLDHGAWVPLRFLYPEARVPVVPVSLPAALAADDLYRLGEALRPLRAEGVLVLGSGGVVHNLRLFDPRHPDVPVPAWAREFDAWFKSALDRLDAGALLQYERLAPHARRAVPTFDHLAPVFVVVGAGRDGKRVEHLFEGFQYGSISMRCFAIV